MAWGLRPAAWGGGAGKAEVRSDVRVPMRQPMAAPWAALVAVTTAASMGIDCLASHARKPPSSSLNRACTCDIGFGGEPAGANTKPCRPSMADAAGPLGAFRLSCFLKLVLFIGKERAHTEQVKIDEKDREAA